MSNRLRLRQKLYQRKTIVVGSIIISLTAALVVFFQLSRVDKTQAAVRQVVIEEQQFTNDMTLPSPVIRADAAITGPVQLARKVKEDNSTDLPADGQGSNSK